jgi:hypothetical protein
VLLATRTVGGIFSTVVSIASLITYPALLALGVPPLSASMGMTSKATAERLYLSVNTVNTHLRHAFAKLGVRSRVELTRIALAHQPPTA